MAPVDARLASVEGHVRALRGMVNDGEDCRQLMHQLHGIKAALDQVGLQLLVDHCEALLLEAVQAQDTTGHRGVVERLAKDFEAFARS